MEINQITNLSLKENIYKLLEMCGSTTKESMYLQTNLYIV